ncbi:MAG: voltage-gated potassium channel, partial [Actinomycetota bacterium]|nr:voltage-gated potassium channel [Actinomycetota bacterium]
VVFSVPVLWPDAEVWVLRGCAVAEQGIWFLFAADLVVRTALAEKRWAYLREHWFDVLAVALPMARPFRPLRALLALGVLARNGRVVTRNQVVGTITLIASASCLLASVAVLDAERHAGNANITSIADALWWSVCTVTTIGYGDRFPVTGTGRVVALTLMAVGISLIGVITAAMASWFVEKLSAVAEAEAAASADTRTLIAEIEALRGEVRALTNGPDSSASESGSNDPGRRY